MQLLHQDQALYIQVRGLPHFTVMTPGHRSGNGKPGEVMEVYKWLFPGLEKSWGKKSLKFKKILEMFLLS